MEKNGLSPTKKTSSSELLSFDNTWIYTKLNVRSAKLIWRISNFGFSFQNCYWVNLSSDVFSSAAVDDNVKWVLDIKSDPHDDIKMELRLSNCEPENLIIRAQYKFIIYDKMMNEAYVVSKYYEFDGKSSSILEVICKPTDIFAADKKILSNDEITVGCEVKYVDAALCSTGKDCNPKFMYAKCRFNNLEHIFKSQELSDVKINIGKRTFDAHKAILAAASPVFLAMFTCTMTEREQNSINIDDMDEETFEEMLRYIYTGNMNKIENIADTLFAAADKYSIDKLKQICETQLCKSVTVENAVRILILADLHNSDWLKAKVINFTKLDPVGVTKTEDFYSMIVSYRHLLAEIMSAIIEK